MSETPEQFTNRMLYLHGSGIEWSAEDRATLRTAAGMDVALPSPVQWVSPAEGATVSGVMFEKANSGPSGPIEVTVDGSPASVVFKVDSTTLNTERAAPFNGKLDTRTLSDGPHVLAAVAYDSAGAVLGQAERTIIVRNVVVPVPAPPSSGPVGIPGAFRLVKADNFDGPTLDPMWLPGWYAREVSNPVNKSGPYAEAAGHLASNVVLPGDGLLHLKLTKPTGGVKCPDGVTRPYGGAMVTTNPKDGRSSPGFSFTYGVLEVRASLPAFAPGVVANWPAIWTTWIGWPGGGEIDAVEGLGGKGAWHYHYADSSGAHKSAGSSPAGDWTGWHTFAYDWSPGLIVVYYDGREVGRVTSGVISGPQYIALNNSVMVGSSYAKAPADMLVDYVRVFARV